MNSTPPDPAPDEEAARVAADARLLKWVIAAGIALLLIWIGIVLLAFVG